MGYFARFLGMFMTITAFESFIHGNLTYISSPQNWYRANLECTGKLAGSEDIPQLAAILPTNESLAWINQMAWFSDLVFYQGCYKFESGMNIIVDTIHTKKDTGVVTCMENCRRSGWTTFSLMGHTCYCLLKDTGVLELENITTCNVTCSADPTDFCGGPEVMSVYTTVKRAVDDITINSKNTECFNALKFKDMMSTYTEDCHEIRQGYFCRTYTSSGYVDELHVKNCTWYNAREACMRRNGVLSENIGMLSQGKDGQYWTGLRRYIVKHSDMLVLQYLCIACKTINNKTECVHRECSEEYGFICKDFHPPILLIETSTSQSESENLEILDMTPGGMTSPEMTLPDTKSPDMTTSDMTNITSVMNTSESVSENENSTQTTPLVPGTYNVTRQPLLQTTMLRSTDNDKIITQRPIMTTTLLNRPGDNRTFGPFLALGIIAGLLFVLSVAGVIIISLSHKCKHHQLTNSTSHNGKIVLTQIERQRSFSNPGFHDGSIGLFMSSMEDLDKNLSNSNADLEAGNERKCDDCSTFTLKKRLAEAANSSPHSDRYTLLPEIEKGSTQMQEEHGEKQHVNVETENSANEIVNDDVFEQ